MVTPGENCASEGMSAESGNTKNFEQRRADFRTGLRFCLWIIGGIIAFGVVWIGGIISTGYNYQGIHWEALFGVLPILIPLLCLFSWDLIEYFVQRSKGRGGAGVWSNPTFMIGGVMLPAMGAGLGLLAYGAGALTFDFPTCAAQMLLLSMIPIGNRLVWSSLLSEQNRQSTVIEPDSSTSVPGSDDGKAKRKAATVPLLNGFVTGIAFTYAIIELILFYKAAQHWSPWFDWGNSVFNPFFIVFLVLISSPIAALLSAAKLHILVLLRCNEQQRRYASNLAIGGAVLGILAMVAPTLPHTFNRILAFQAISDDNSTDEKERALLEEKHRAAIRTLRAGAIQPMFLEDCYAPSLEMAAFLYCIVCEQSPEYVSPEGFREVFYRVYGKSASDFPAPLRFLPAIWMQDWQRGFQHVGAKIAGLNLASSGMHGVIDSKAALGYLEWTLTFQNDSPNDQEARTNIALPPGAVVSRATLWVRGKEREAAITERGLATSTYQSIVRVNHDPLLVSSAGQDLVLVQCFPVPAHGQMKVKIGITAPVAIDNDSSCHLILPSLTESNFEPSALHQLDIKANGAIRLGGSEQSNETPGSNIGRQDTHGAIVAQPTNAEQRIQLLKEDISNDLLKRSNALITISRDRTQSFSCQTQDQHVGTDGQYCSESINESLKPVKHVFIVIDGSTSVGKYQPELVRAFKELPSEFETSIQFASDEITSLSPAAAGVGGTAYSTDTSKQIRQAPFVGGPDNWNYLKRAWQAADKQDQSALVWIHGPQPNLPRGFYRNSFFPGQYLTGQYGDNRTLSAFAGKKTSPLFYDVEVERGPNRIREMFEQSANEKAPVLLPLDRHAALDEDLKTLFQRLAGKKPFYTIELAKGAKTDNCPEIEVPGAADCLVKLWAYRETMHRLAGGDTKGALHLATAYQLVTPVTAAIVLETRQQYKDAHIDVPTGDAEHNTGANINWFGQSSARDANLFGGSSQKEAQIRTPSASAMPMAATNGTMVNQLNKLNSVSNSASDSIGSQGTKDTVVQGVNTAGTVRVNSSANFREEGKSDQSSNPIPWIVSAIAILLVVAVLAFVGLGKNAKSSKD